MQVTALRFTEQYTNIQDACQQFVGTFKCHSEQRTHDNNE